MATHNSLYFLGAAIVGIVSAAGLFIAEHFRQERRRHAMVKDLVRLDQQLRGMQNELEQLRLLQKDKSAHRLRKSKVRTARSLSSLSSTSDTVDEDSSDLEFYDLSEDESTADTINTLDKILSDADNILNLSNLEEIKLTVSKLTNLCTDFPDNPELLWRIGKGQHKIASATTDTVTKQEYTEKGIAACSEALKLNPNIAEAHKWYAILIGSRASTQSIKEKISDGYLFKQHLDEGLRLNPNDATLNHLLARFSYECAKLKWYERKVAATFFAEPPTGTFEEALGYCLEAERLAEMNWKENKLLIAKCQIGLNNFNDAIDTLSKADIMEDNTCLDITIDNEIKMLLQQYNGYR